MIADSEPPSKTSKVKVLVSNKFKIINRSIKGATFCQVASSMQEPQGKPAITEGTHIWKGAIPSFIINPKLIAAILE